jgi:hypothetical protein
MLSVLWLSLFLTGDSPVEEIKKRVPEWVLNTWKPYNPETFRRPALPYEVVTPPERPFSDFEFFESKDKLASPFVRLPFPFSLSHPFAIYISPEYPEQRVQLSPKLYVYSVEPINESVCMFLCDWGR